MTGYSVRDFVRILYNNGFMFSRQNGSHSTYIKNGCSYIVTIPDKGSAKSKELSRPLIDRIIKNAGLKV